MPKDIWLKASVEDLRIRIERPERQVGELEPDSTSNPQRLRLLSSRGSRRSIADCG